MYPRCQLDHGSETDSRITATDDDGQARCLPCDAATFTVTAVNDVPVVDDIPDETVSEGTAFATIALDGYVADVETLDADIVWSYSGNTDADGRDCGPGGHDQRTGCQLERQRDDHVHATDDDASPLVCRRCRHLYGHGGQ